MAEEEAVCESNSNSYSSSFILRIADLNNKVTFKKIYKSNVSKLFAQYGVSLCSIRTPN
jgi:hypothetical protein